MQGLGTRRKEATACLGTRAYFPREGNVAGRVEWRTGVWEGGTTPGRHRAAESKAHLGILNVRRECGPMVTATHKQLQEKPEKQQSDGWAKKKARAREAEHAEEAGFLLMQRSWKQVDNVEELTKLLKGFLNFLFKYLAELFMVFKPNQLRTCPFKNHEPPGCAHIYVCVVGGWVVYV